MTETTTNPKADPKAELAAMKAVTDALADLDPATAGRVLRWAGEALGVASARVEARVAPTPETNGGAAGRFASLADLYAAASPETDADRALVAGYWFQFIEGGAAFGSQQINTALKNLGYGVANITTAFDTLMARKPAFVMQLKKAGTTKQARKEYKLTSAGKQAVELMIGQQ
jgi:hypothetical protein